MRSNKFKDIIEKEPSWLVRWGIISMLFFIFIILGLSNLVSYPDVNKARVKLTSTSIPISHFGKKNGYLKKTNVQEGDTINHGDILAIIDNNSDLNEIKTLAKWLKKKNVNSLEDLSYKNIPNLKNLGKLQPIFNDLLLILNEGKQYLNSNTYTKKIAKSNSDLLNNKKLLQVENKKYILIKKELELIKKDLNRNKELFIDNVIPVAEMDQYKKMHIKKMMEVENVKSNLINIELKINSISESIQELKDLKEKKESELLLRFKNIIKELRSSYQDWRDKYIISAKAKGKVAYTKEWKSGEFVNPSDLIVTIIPLDDHQIFATGKLPIANAGKVNAGQKVNIKLDDYPYKEFGMLKGKLVHISQTQSDGFYYIKIIITEEINFNNRKKFHWFKPKMMGTAEIITEENTILQRLLFKLR